MANMLTNICDNLEIEPRLLPVTGIKLENQTVSRHNKVRVDIRSRGFCVRGQQTFFDIRVLFNLNANRYL